jgi:hypothetical protein
VHLPYRHFLGKYTAVIFVAVYVVVSEDTFLFRINKMSGFRTVASTHTIHAEQVHALYTVCYFCMLAACDLAHMCCSVLCVVWCGAGSPVYAWLLTLLSFAPYYIRLMQSMRGWADTGEIRHLFNAWKYTLSLSVTGLALSHKHFPELTFLNTAW